MNKNDMVFFVIAIMTYATSLFAETSPLPLNQAFPLSIQFSRPHQVIMTFQIPSRYYLYAKRLKIQSQPDYAVSFQYPKSIWHQNIEHVREKVYAGNTQIFVQTNPRVDTFRLAIHYQGCSQEGFCYQPIDRQFTLNNVTHAIMEITTGCCKNTCKERPSHADNKPAMA